MGLFSKRGPCNICNQEEGSKKLVNGIACKNCMAKSFGFVSSMDAKSLTVESIKQALFERGKNEELGKMFSPTQKVEKYFEVDEAHQLWKVPGVFPNIIFSFQEVLRFELLENGSAITKGGLGSAIVGGALFGGVGAIVGSAVGGKKVKQEITEYRIKIVVKKPYMSEIYINILGFGKVKADSFVHRANVQTAQNILSHLALMADAVKTPERAPDSVADEIAKFKSLLDQGAITQDEYDAKKSQLLSI